MNNQNNSSALSAEEQQAVLNDQVRAWTKERDRLNDMIATAHGKNNSSAHSGDELSQERNFSVCYFLHTLDEYAEEHGTELVPINRQSAIIRELNALFATQPPVDRVQGGLTDEQIIEIVANVASKSLDMTRVHELGGKTSTIMDEAGVIEFARAILSRQSAAPQEQAERPDHETIISEGGKLVCTACGTTTPANAAAANGDGLAETKHNAVRDAIAEALCDAYDCTRVWSAWSYGTMGPDDFSLVAEDDSRLDEITDAAISAMAAPDADGQKGEA